MSISQPQCLKIFNQVSLKLILFLDQIWLRTELLHTPSSIWSGIKLMTTRSWSTFHVTEMPDLTTWPSVTYMSCHWGNGMKKRGGCGQRVHLRQFWAAQSTSQPNIQCYLSITQLIILHYIHTCAVCPLQMTWCLFYMFVRDQVTCSVRQRGHHIRNKKGNVAPFFLLGLFILNQSPGK